MNKIILSISFLTSLSVFSQTKTFTEKLEGIKTSSKELTKSASTDNSSVGQSGVMSTTVPLVTVSSKAMSFPLQLNYTSGITANQNSGPVGLGWNMSVGSIVRDFGAFQPDYTSTQHEGDMKSVTGSIQSWLNPSNNGGVNPSSHNQVLKYNLAPSSDRPIPLSDMYHINVPNLGSNSFWNGGSIGGSHNWKLTEHENWKIEHSVKTYSIDQEYSRINEVNLAVMANSDGFSLGSSYASAIGVLPYVINGSAGSFDPVNVTKVLYEDFEEFIITTDDGTKYIFGRALRGQKYVFDNDPYWSSKIANVSNAANGSYWKIDYIAEWLLTEIRSVDFVDANNNGIADDGDSGDWIRFDYTDATQNVTTVPKTSTSKYTSTVPKHREWSNYSQTDQASSLMRERAYLTHIVTPTQNVDFTISQRFDVEHDYYNKPANKVGNQYFYENRKYGSNNGSITDFDILYPIETMKYDEIKVYSKLIDKVLYPTENLLTQAIVLNYAQKGSPQELAVSEYLIRNNNNTPKLNTDGTVLGAPSSTAPFDIEKYKNTTDKRGKTTLLSVDFYGGQIVSSEKTSYKFEYAYNPSFNEIHKRDIVRKWSSPSLRQGSNSQNIPFANTKAYYLIPTYKEEILGPLGTQITPITRSLISTDNFHIDIPYQENIYKLTFNSSAEVNTYVESNNQSLISPLTNTPLTKYLNPIVDVFGFLYADNCTQCPKAWSLTKITYPTGGEISFEYEQGTFDKDADKNNWSFDDTEVPIIREYNELAKKRSYIQDAYNRRAANNSAPTINGQRKTLTATFEVNLPTNYGIRLKSKTINDKINPIVTVNYAYQNGHFTSIPSQYLQSVIGSFNQFIIREKQRHAWEETRYGPQSASNGWITDFEEKMKHASITGIALDEYTSTHFYEKIDQKNTDNSFVRTYYGPIGSTSNVMYDATKLYCYKLPMPGTDGSYVLAPTELNTNPIYPEKVEFYDATSTIPYKTIESTYALSTILSYNFKVDYTGGTANPNTVKLWDNTFEIYSIISDSYNSSVVTFENTNLWTIPTNPFISSYGFAYIAGRYTTSSLYLPYGGDTGPNAYTFQRWGSFKTVLTNTKTTYKGLVSNKKYIYDPTDYTLLTEEDNYPSLNTKYITTHEYAHTTYAALTNKFQTLNLKKIPTRTNTYLNTISASTVLSATMSTFDYSFSVPKPKNNFVYETTAVNPTTGVFTLVDFNINSTSNPNWRINQNTNLEYNENGSLISSKVNRLYNKMVYGNNLNVTKATFAFPDSKFDATYTGFEDYFGMHGMSDWNTQEYKNETWFLPSVSQTIQPVLTISDYNTCGNNSSFVRTIAGSSYTYYHIVTVNDISNLQVGQQITLIFNSTTFTTTISNIIPKTDITANGYFVQPNAQNYILCFTTPIAFTGDPTMQTYTLNLNTTKVDYLLSKSYTRTGEYSYKLPTQRIIDTPFNKTPLRPVKIISHNISECSQLADPANLSKSNTVPENCKWKYEASVWLKYDFDVPQLLETRGDGATQTSADLSGDTKYLRGTVTETDNASQVKIICDVYNSARTILIEQKVFYVVGLDAQWRQYTVEIPLIKNANRWLDVYVVNERSQVGQQMQNYKSVFVDDIAIYPKGAKYSYSTINKFGAPTFKVDNNDVFTETIYDAKARPIVGINQYGTKTKEFGYFEVPNWTNQQNYVTELNWIDNGVYNQTRTYLDGFGKTKQVMVSDLTRGSRLITETNVYNAKGEVIQSYKPYVLSGATLGNSFDPNFALKTIEFYGSNFAFNQATYESKPESVISSYSQPRLNTEQAIITTQSEYLNTVGISSATLGLNYVANTLLVHQVIETNGSIVRTYIDLMGRVVMEEHQIGTDYVQNTDGSMTLIASPDIFAQTWYKYDNAGRLIMVCDPDNKVSNYTYNSLGVLIKSVTPDKGISELRYDDYGQVRFVRNEKDRQAVLGSIYGTDQFKYSKFDAWGRVIESGMIMAAPNTAGLNPSSLPFPAQNYFDNILTINNQDFPTASQKLVQIHMQNTYDGTRSLFNSDKLLTETSVSGHILTASYTYTSSNTDKKSYEYMADGQLAKTKYEYQGLTGVHTVEPIYNAMRIPTGKKYIHPTQANLNFTWNSEIDNFGRIKVSKNTHNGITTQTGKYYYDIFGNLLMQGLGTTGNTTNPHIDYVVNKQNIRNQVVNQMTKNLRIGLTYDLVGNITNQYWSSEQFDPTTGPTVSVNQYEYSYDKLNRLVVADYKKGTYTQNPFTYFSTISSNLPDDFDAAVDQQLFFQKTTPIFNELQEVINTSRTPELARKASSALNTFQVEYLKNNVSYETMSATEQEEFLTYYINQAIISKSEPIYYEQYMATKYADQAHLTLLSSGTFTTAKLKYIKQLVESTKINPNLYYYPNASATVYGNLPDFQPPATTTNVLPYDEAFWYSKNGNMSKLNRNNETGVKTQQLYSYANPLNNQLTGVVFTNMSTAVSASHTYSYDLNGNLLHDSRNGITDISYISFNDMPQSITNGSGMKSYRYDNKGQRIVKRNSATDIEFYLDDVILATNGMVKSYQTKEGYAVPLPTGTSVNYFYNIKDWLGTNRVVLNASGVRVNVTDHYAYGLKMPLRNYNGDVEGNRYQFTGHEFDGETNYDYHGARYYNRELGRYMSVDPLAQQFASWSTYNYCMGNPVNLIDPTGKGPEDPPTKTYSGAGGTELELPADATIVNKYIDENKNGKISVDGGKTNLDAKDGDIWKFNVSGTTYAAQYKEGKFNGYWDGKGNKYIPQSTKDLSQILDVSGKVLSTGGALSNGLENVFLESSKQTFRYASSTHSAAQLTELNKLSSLKSASTCAKIGNGLTVLSVGVTVTDAVINGPKAHHAVDLAVTAGIYYTCASVPVFGWAAGLVYFAADMTSQAVSGKSLSQNACEGVGFE